MELGTIHTEEEEGWRWNKEQKTQRKKLGEGGTRNMTHIQRKK